MSENSRKIYVLYPRGLRTGGPEALHQLVDMLRGLGQDAYLVPHPATASAARAEQFGIYNAPEAPAAVDAEGNVVVVPEVYISELHSYKRATPVCWWLSIDYSPTFVAGRTALRSAAGPLASLRETLIPRLSAIKNHVDPRSIAKSRIVHAVQSSYAWAFLFSQLNVVPSLLSDYTPSAEFLSRGEDGSRNHRLVTFNPVKGGDIIREVMSVCDPSIEWRPIQGMTRTEVTSTLGECGIYLDLGFHPGKDRMPREAALSGALTVVGRRGSGAFYSDVPVPWEHKITPGPTEVSAAAALLPQLMADLPAEIAKQDSYRAAILSEKDRFKREVSDIFVEQRFGKDAADYVGV
ncbi:hypothetical protein [Pseudarthrobacter sp. PvP090]|uniref:hypothetical protein n=1 Tax=Pseudarthrobacter sp. PvP090 TaxID=3156393 RepID=UPI00339784BE